MEALRTLLEAIYQVYARLTRARVITLGLEQQNMGTSGPLSLGAQGPCARGAQRALEMVSVSMC